MLERRRELRRNQTSAEKALWNRVRAKQLNGFKFFRQYSIGPYIVDFYCPEKHLVVELDGESHFADDAVIYDKERTAYLNSLHIRVLRFLNTDIYDNIDAVCARVLAEMEAVPGQ